MTLYPKLILDALATVRYPGNKKNLVEAEMVADNLRIDGMKVSFSLIFEKPTDPFMKSMVKAAETAIHTYVSPEVEVTIATESRQAARPEVGKLLPQVKNIIGVSSGKGGVGKSTMTVLLASYFHYVKGKNVAVIDCDYPQFSIQALRSRDMKNVERSEFLQQLLCRQYERTGKKAYPVLTSGPGKVLETADRLSGNSDILFFDLPGTVNTPGILEAIINMDYVFTPVVQDRMVMQSSLSFVATLRDFIRQYPEAPLKEILLFWNKIDGRVSREVYRHYNEIFEKIGLKTLSTVMPDMERYNKETSSGGQTFFRSTYFPPSEKLLKGSNMDVLAGEIERIIHLKSDKT